jgi:hypothetical protein
MSIISNLVELNKVAPDICAVGHFGRWRVGRYEYGPGNGETINAIEAGGFGRVASGDDALDLLTGVLCRAIEARGWDYKIVSWQDKKIAELWTDEECIQRSTCGHAEALLAALLAALEAE